MKLLEQHRHFAVIASILAIVGVIVFNLVWYGAGLIGPAADPVQLAPMVDPITGRTLEPAPGVFHQAMATPVIPLVATGSILLLIALISVLLVKRAERSRNARDAQRRADLAAIAAAFEAYRGKIETYPLSLTTAAAYYTGVSIPRDWRFHAFPSDEEMRGYLPAWPLTDPSVPADARDQTNAYLYVPHDNGRRFDLYAHLEAPEPNAQDCNRDDALPIAWGVYQYKLSSPDPNPTLIADCPEAAPPLETSPA